ncbi:Gti1/Pac2 family-domain-containing protein [Aspergillus multicolor]|uniref:camp independent regulatory protein n=1 Tax=Aspergillus multicolor TaxID=41759 RepID=UPI003CCD6708
METYHGHVRTPADAIILFEACRIGMLPRVQRRLSEKERQLIQSGSVFVWDEREAGMRRWTDGKSWSASRVSGSFLTYREMEGKRGGTSVPTQPTRGGKTPESGPGSDDGGEGLDDGPDGYRYKPDGLMKQSFSITTSTGQHLHLISYYSRGHPNAANLLQPSTDPALRSVRPQKGLYPESTVNDQQNLPVVTRGPMTGAPYAVPPPPPPQHPMAAAYARSGAAHPQSYAPAYAWPPTPLGTPPAVPIHYPAYVSPHHPPQYHALPAPPQQPGLPPGYDRAVYDRAIHPMEGVPIPAHLIPQGSIIIPARSPRVMAEPTPPEYGPDHRRASPRIPPPHPHPSPHVNGVAIPLPGTRSPRVLSQAPPPPPATLSIPPPNPLSRSPSETNGAAVPSINVLMNSTPGSLPSISAAVPPPSLAPAGSGAPATAHTPVAVVANGRAAEGPRDIPSDKIGFGGEDMRALRQLDRVFKA